MTVLRLSVAALAAIMTLAALPAKAQLAEAPSTVEAVYRAPSATRALKPGEKIGNLFHLNLEQPYVLQRLTERTYWYQSGFYETIFYVGDNGVLLFDPLDGQADKILQAIRSVTDKPVTAIAYSHDHADHIGGTQAFLDLIGEQAAKPRIFASQATAEKMERLNSTLPRPTEIIAWPNGSFTFEGLKVDLHGFEHAAHTDDHSVWLLVGERVLHAPDLLNADQPPFWSFAGAERFTYLESNLRDADSLPWEYLSGGHGNVGSHADFAFHLRFIADLKAAVSKAMAEVPWGFGVDTSQINAHTSMLPAWYGEIARRATESLRPEYGQYYGFDTATPANAEMVAEFYLSYR